MSVVSKIFIIVNLLLTLLLLAAMGRKIDYSFKGTYKRQYRANNAALIKAKEDLENTIKNRVEQVKELRKRVDVSKGKLNEAKTQAGSLNAALNDRKQAIKEKSDQKTDLRRQINGEVSKGQGLNREEKGLQEKLKTTKGEIQATILRMKRAINSYHATKRTAEDLAAALKASN